MENLDSGDCICDGVLGVYWALVIDWVAGSRHTMGSVWVYE